MADENTQTPVAASEKPQTEAKALEKRRATLDIIESLKDAKLQAQNLQALIDNEIQRDLFDQDYKTARVFAVSGQFGDLKDMSQEQAIATAMAKIRMGRSWDLKEADAIQYVYFSNGRPSLMNEIVAAKLQESGIAWDVEWHEEQAQHKNKPYKKVVGCTLWLKRWSDQFQKFVPMTDRENKPISVSFTEADADTAMIWEKGKQIPLSSKWNFQSWARDMYYWRCVGRVKKFYAPNVLRGARLREEAADVIDVTDDLETLMPQQEPEAQKPPNNKLRQVLGIADEKPAEQQPLMQEEEEPEA
jgi:hypothetical protein